MLELTVVASIIVDGQASFKTEKVETVQFKDLVDACMRQGALTVCAVTVHVYYNSCVLVYIYTFGVKLQYHQ